MELKDLGAMIYNEEKYIKNIYLLNCGSKEVLLLLFKHDMFYIDLQSEDSQIQEVELDPNQYGELRYAIPHRREI